MSMLRFFSRLAVLTVFLFSIVSTAQAQSVIGAGVIKAGYFREIPITISISARIGPTGPQGTLRKGPGESETVCKIVDLCVVGKQAFVVARITHSTAGEPEGWFLFFNFQDNGQTGDAVSYVFPIISPLPVSACSLIGGDLLPSWLVTEGGFVVSPSE